VHYTNQVDVVRLAGCQLLSVAALRLRLLLCWLRQLLCSRLCTLLSLLLLLLSLNRSRKLSVIHNPPRPDIKQPAADSAEQHLTFGWQN
jgi:hypothetical protein